MTLLRPDGTPYRDFQTDTRLIGSRVVQTADEIEISDGQLVPWYTAYQIPKGFLLNFVECHACWTFHIFAIETAVNITQQVNYVGEESVLGSWRQCALGVAALYHCPLDVMFQRRFVEACALQAQHLSLPVPTELTRWMLSGGQVYDKKERKGI